MCQLHRAAMQGLSVMMMFVDREALDPMLGLLHRYKESMVDQLIASSAPPGPRLVKTHVDANKPS